MARGCEHLSIVELELLSLVPEALPPRQVARPLPGRDNTIAVVGERWVIRIARTEVARSYHANEVAVLNKLDGHRVPRPLGVMHCGIVYEHIRGERLTSHAWHELSHAARRAVAADIRIVLSALHVLPIEALPDAAEILDRAWVLDSIERCSSMKPRAPLRFEPARLAERFEAAWANMGEQKSVVHVDLKPDNLVIDDDRASVIDFGGTCLGDPAIDYGILTHHFGEELLDAMDLTGTSLATRARCYADLYHLRRCTRGWTRSPETLTSTR